MGGPISDDVKRLVDRCVESVDQLEVLRVLGDQRSRRWDTASIASEIQADSTTVVAALRALQDRGLIRAEAKDSEWVAWFEPRDAELAQDVEQLLNLYREKPVSMIRLIYDRSRDPLRSFADAFRIRKGET